MKRKTTEQDFRLINSFLPDDCKFEILDLPDNIHGEDYMKWWEEMMKQMDLAFEKYSKKYKKSLDTNHALIRYHNIIIEGNPQDQIKSFYPNKD